MFFLDVEIDQVHVIFFLESFRFDTNFQLADIGIFLVQHYLMHFVLCNELNDSLIIVRLPVFMYINFNTTNYCLKQRI